MAAVSRLPGWLCMSDTRPVILTLCESIRPMPLSLILASSPPFTNHDSSHCSSAALPHADMLHPCVCASPRRSRSGRSWCTCGRSTRRCPSSRRTARRSPPTCAGINFASISDKLPASHIINHTKKMLGNSKYPPRVRCHYSECSLYHIFHVYARAACARMTCLGPRHHRRPPTPTLPARCR